MAGAKDGIFTELISPFLKHKINDLEEQYGKTSAEWNAIASQYQRSPLEETLGSDERRRHYESEVTHSFLGEPLVGVERLYRRTILIEPTTACASHCRWCLRGQYPIKTLKPSQIDTIARYIGESAICRDVEEVLITGGDPCMVPSLLKHTLISLQEHSPNVKTIRIGTRIPFQDPKRIDQELLSILSLTKQEIEIAVNVNHPIEFWPESLDALARLKGLGLRIYNQHPLLKGVNDNLSILLELYDQLRSLGIEAHYLFHAIPMQGMSHHRTSIAKGLELVSRLCSSGGFSGRAKPRFALMTDIGKVILYEGSIIARRAFDHSVFVRTGYRAEDRKRWNPSWRTPENVEHDSDGFMAVWYKDGDDASPLTS
jgi:lysine 2,3-aminomutase